MERWICVGGGVEGEGSEGEWTDTVVVGLW